MLMTCQESGLLRSLGLFPFHLALQNDSPVFACRSRNSLLMLTKQGEKPRNRGVFFCQLLSELEKLSTGFFFFSSSSLPSDCQSNAKAESFSINTSSIICFCHSSSPLSSRSAPLTAEWDAANSATELFQRSPAAESLILIGRD